MPRLTSATLALTAFALQTSASLLTPNPSNDRNLFGRSLNTGLGTRYGKNCNEEDCWQNGACAFTDYTLPSAVDGSTCVSEDIWDSSAQCGGCISVSYKGKTIVVMVTNKTDPGDKNHLDMPPDTWNKLTNNTPGGGVDGIEWEWVKCPIKDPLSIHMHGGASKYWFAATVENATRRTKSLEVSTDEGKTWKSTERDTNNFFVADGVLDSDKAWVKVTSHTDTEVIVKDVVLESKKVTKGTKNYA
ncbi:hypothetical protein Q7P37_007460 [Cladosporium fusiforme]